MRRRLVLHLGLSKTGTTSIQSFLRANPDWLASHGAVYPEVIAGSAVHPALAPSVLRRNAGRESNHVALAMEIRRGSDVSLAAERGTPLWSDVFKRIASGEAHTAIISYENFYQRPDLFRFDLLSSHLKDFEVQGMIYLRPQEDWFVSLYAQMIRGTTRIATSFSDFVDARREYLMYSAVLDNICAHIPLEHLIVGDFEATRATGLLTDFMEKIGLPGDVPLPEEVDAPANLSLPHWASLFLLACNRARIPDEAFIDVRRLLTRHMARVEPPALRPGLDVATPEQRESLRRSADADADRLQGRYGIVLARRPSEPAAPRPLDAQDIETIRSALATGISPATRKALRRL